MKIVTGHRGEPHITPNDQQGFNQGVFHGDEVLKVGKEFLAQLTTATSLTIKDGEGVMQGVHFRIEPGIVETLEISSGVSYYSRSDLVCARYTKDETTGIEDVQLIVIEGEPEAGSSIRPEDPDYIEGDILSGDLIADFPLYRVLVNGLSATVEKVFPLQQFGTASASKSASTNIAAGATVEIGLDFLQKFSRGFYKVDFALEWDAPTKATTELRFFGTSAKYEAESAKMVTTGSAFANCNTSSDSARTLAVTNNSDSTRTLSACTVYVTRIV